jgi:hypothetical protein
MSKFKTVVGVLAGGPHGPPLGVWKPARIAGDYKMERTHVRAIKRAVKAINNNPELTKTVQKLMMEILRKRKMYVYEGTNHGRRGE